MDAIHDKRNFNHHFPLWHCVLYYLGWYHRTSNSWDDLRKCLEMDGYYTQGQQHRGTIELIFSILDDWNLYCAIHGLKMISTANLIPDVWYEEFYRTADGGEGDSYYLSVLWQLIGEWATGYTRQEVKLPRPVFKKGDSLKYSGYGTGKTYKQANSFTRKYNNWVEI